MLNHKKVLSLALASAMSLSMMAPAFAADTESTTNRSLKIDGTYKETTIDVVVPTTGTVIINPYALPCVIVDKTETAAAIKVKDQQIVTKPLAIKNQSDVKLDVNVSATATVKGNLTLATAPITDVAKDTKNDAFVYLVLADMSSDTTLVGAKTAVTQSVIDTAYQKQVETTKWTEYTTTNTPANVLALKTSAVTGEKMVTLAAATLETDGSFKEYNAGSIAFVGLTGQCAQNPKTAWTTKDGLTATIAFTFTPNTTAASTTPTPSGDPDPDPSGDD
jgi:hypothetical protein